MRSNRAWGLVAVLSLASSGACGAPREQAAQEPARATAPEAGPVLRDATPRAAEEEVSMNDLARALVDLGYRELFMRLDSARLDELWKKHGSAGFAALVSGTSTDPYARFLAAEVLYRKGQALPTDLDRTAAARAYVWALANNAIGVANPWGLPRELGPVAQHLLEFGKQAVPYLLYCLDNDTVIPYAGSEEATIGDEYQFRVKDFAAQYLSITLMLSLPMNKSAAERDRAIERMRSLIEQQPRDPNE